MNILTPEQRAEIERAGERPGADRGSRNENPIYHHIGEKSYFNVCSALVADRKQS